MLRGSSIGSGGDLTSGMLASWSEHGAVWRRQREMRAHRCEETAEASEADAKQILAFPQPAPRQCRLSPALKGRRSTTPSDCLSP